MSIRQFSESAKKKAAESPRISDPWSEILNSYLIELTDIVLDGDDSDVAYLTPQATSKHLAALKALALAEALEMLPSGEVDLVKFERDKTGWIEEVGVDPDTLTSRDLIAVWQLARHFKQQAITEMEKNLKDHYGGDAK